MDEKHPETELIEDLYESDVDEWISHPVSKFLIDSMASRGRYNQEALLRGDIEVRNRDELNYVYRSNEGLRGGLLEISYIMTFPTYLKEEIKRIQEEAKLNKLHEEMDEENG